MSIDTVSLFAARVKDPASEPINASPPGKEAKTMKQTRFESVAWRQALTLNERLALRRAAAQGSRTAPSAQNLALADRRFQRWREQSPFSTDDLFAQRLALDGMSEDEFRALLSEPIEAMQGRAAAPLEWLERIEQSFARPVAAESRSMLKELSGHAAVGFLWAIEPLIRQGYDQLRAGIQALAQAYADRPFEPGAVGGALFANLPARLLRLLNRAMVAELNIARVEGVLRGDTTEARFQSFVQQLRDHERALDILELYPVLARQIVLAIDTWVAVSLEFLGHLCADLAALRAQFSPNGELDILIKVDAGAGDIHKGGRSVVVVEFRSGLRLVYKPRSLAVEQHFQDLLSWLNERGAQPTFQTTKILDRQNHGWVEFIQARSCTTSDEIERFYRRQGGYLALLYALEATDFHYENLIAAGEHPMLIDLESLFHPRTNSKDLAQSENLAGQTMSYSVLRILLLPRRIFGNDQSEGIDISGLGGTAGQLSPTAMLDLEATGTDEMHFVRRRKPLPGSQNRPNLNGADVDPLDYTEMIVTGFTDMYRLLLSRRDALLAEDGPLARFGEDEVRLILRPTRAYGGLLYEGFHPYLLRNALDRDRHFDRLWLGLGAQPHLARVILAERADLLRGDIPIFTTRPNTRDVWSSSGERIAELLEEVGLDLVYQRVRGLSADDLARQIWFIRASMATLAIEVNQASGPASPWVFSASRRAAAEGALAPALTSRTGGVGDLRARLLDSARAIGDRLDALALRGRDGIAWIGLEMKQGERWELAPAGIDLYSGLPGLALFLAYLGASTGEARYTNLADAALESLRREIDRARPWHKYIGAFFGWGGAIYTLTHLAALWNRPELLAEAEALVEVLPALIEQDETLDVVGGVAGCILSLRDLYRAVPSERIRSVLVACGERLIARAQPAPGPSGDGTVAALGWPAPIPTAGPLVGLSHGAAGIAWALLELAALTGELRFQQAALAGIAYERSVFSPAADNWPDLRKLDILGSDAADDHVHFPTLWCHGAPGIGLARLLTLPHLDDEAVRAEIDAALRATLRQGFGGNHSLCHGDLGNLETVLQAAQRLDDRFWRAEVDRLAAMILDSIDQNGWRYGVPLNVETPGLMTGLAGIGYGLLRLADPDRVPSVLALEAPQR
jgi:type 2 lantibiotic biosynthesis protein LanM